MYQAPALVGWVTRLVSSLTMLSEYLSTSHLALFLIQAEAVGAEHYSAAKYRCTTAR